MRNRRINVRKFLIIVLCCSVFLTGCFIHLPEPPSKDEIETWFRENREDITLVTEQLLLLEYRSCSIWEGDGPVSYLGSEVTVNNADFYAAVKMLFQAGCCNIAKLDGDTIELELTKGRRIFAGLAYSPDPKGPNIVYMTQYELIAGETEWYYYVGDYERS